jgi:glycosyltransferase involved in cell wall biosynthesis
MKKTEKEIITVIYVIGNLRTAGPNIQLLYLAANLDRREFKPVFFVTSDSTERSEIEVQIERLGIEIIRIAAGKLSSIFRAPLTLARIANREARVLLHPYGLRSDIICWLSRVRPRVGAVRNNLRYNYQRMFGRRLGSIIAAINAFVLKRTDLIISCGDSVRQNLATLGLESVAIRNAIDPTIYRNLMCGASAAQRDTSTEVSYLTVASKIPGKNIEFLVNEFALASPGSRRLVVIGPASPNLIEKHRYTKTVEFRGHVTKPGDVLLETSFFISASEHEGMPNAVIEALALGRPVVLSKIPAHLEIMQAAGNSVVTTFSLTPASLREALDEVEARDYAVLSKSAHEAATKSFDCVDMALRYQSVYRNLFKGSSALQNALDTP